MAESEKLSISIDNYENLWGMLNSPDKDNAIVGLTLLENSNFRDSFPYILLLLKNQSGNDKKLWNEHCPELMKKLKSEGVEEGTKLTYNMIFAMVKEKCTLNALQFILDKFAPVWVKYSTESWGFTMLKECKVTIVPNL